MATTQWGLPNELTLASPNNPPADINALAEATDDALTAAVTAADNKTSAKLAQGVMIGNVIDYVLAAGVASNASANVVAQTNWGFNPTVVVAQIISNGRLVPVVKSFDTTTTTLELFNPSPSPSSSNCTVRLVALRKVNQS